MYKIINIINFLQNKIFENRFLFRLNKDVLFKKL